MTSLKITMQYGIPKARIGDLVDFGCIAAKVYHGVLLVSRQSLDAGDK